MTTFPIHARTLHGLEAVLVEELRALGAGDVETGKRIVKFTADQRLLYRANACCRSAIRFLKPIHLFTAEDEKELYAGVQQIAWRELLEPTGTLWIDPIVHGSFCTHSRYAAQLTKDAIVDQLRTASGERPSVERYEPDLRISLHLVNNQATVYLDSSGESLHKRGYRQATGEAPLNEVLAAGILQLSQWDRQSPLIDPLCGSGTLVIEAAMLARNIAPILLGRDYAFAKWPDFDRELFRGVYDEAKTAARESLEFAIVGSDIDQAMVNMARENAKWAGVLDDITFNVGSFEVAQPPATGATLVTNPPYDERMKVDRTAAFYHRIGDTLKQNFAGCTAHILTGNLEAAKQIGLRTSRRITLFNGPIECRLLKFDLYAGSKKDSPLLTKEGPGEVASEAENNVDTNIDETPSNSPLPRARKAEAHPRKWLEQAEMFRNRLRKMQKHQGKWARRQGITCYRLYDKDIPDVPLAIDWYEGQLHIAEYVRPHDRAEAEHRAWLEFIIKATADALDVRRRDVFVKLREKKKGTSQYEKRDETGNRIEVHEGGHAFLVNLSDYLDTGLFLDHRQTRAKVQEEAAGKNFLNLFCYTGAFTVYASAGGASATTSVDLSNTYLDWAEANLRANGFDTNPNSSPHRFVHRNVMTFLQDHAAANGSAWDLAVVDPPTFSNSKRTADIWDVQNDHAELLNLLLTQMSPEGSVYFSTNLRRFKFDEAAIRASQIREITNQTIPPDFRNKRVHRCWKLRK